MAKLTNTGCFEVKNQERWDELYGFRAKIRVGNNRWVRMVDGVMECILHDTAVLGWDQRNRTLNVCSCGYVTTTTCAAIGDFAREMDLLNGIACSVSASRAGGDFTVMIGRKVRVARGSEFVWHRTTFGPEDMNAPDGYLIDLSNHNTIKLVGE